MSNKHTPGPWQHTTGDTTVYADGVFVAECVPTSPWADDVPKREARANARLIAAAPELLASLQAVADFWAGGDAPQELTDQMHAAIAKATKS